MANEFAIRNIFNEKIKILRGQSTDLATPWFLDLKRRDFVWLKLMALMQKIMTDCYRFSTTIENKDKEWLYLIRLCIKKRNMV